MPATQQRCKLCPYVGEAIRFDLADCAQYLKEVLQAIAADSDLLITHHSLMAVPGSMLGATRVCQIGLILTAMRKPGKVGVVT